MLIAPDPSPAASPDLPAPVRVNRNSPCPCGSGKKYKHCCHATRPWTGNVRDPQAMGERRLQQFVTYGNDTYHLRRLLESLSDGRRDQIGRAHV